jgi:hypothetical protein
VGMILVDGLAVIIGFGFGFAAFVFVFALL